MVRCGSGTRELATGTLAEDQPSSERGRPGSRDGDRPGPEVVQRAAALSPDEYASPFPRWPDDLRHVAVSTWLNGGVPAAQVAQRAGHRVDVLLRVYVKCIAGREGAVRRRVKEALRAGRDQDRSVHGP